MRIIRGYIGENELGIALEHLCYLVEDARLSISDRAYDALATAGDALRMPPRYWQGLRPGVAA